MKAYLLAGLLIGTAPALVQKAAPPPVTGQESAKPFKGANVILVSTSDSAAVAYKKIAAAILGAGYTIDRADKELGFISTKPRPTPKLNGLHAIRIAIMPMPAGASIQLRSSFSMPGAAAVSPIMAGELETTFRGSNGSLFMICWNELQRLAQSYPNGQITYTKAP